ncbi:MAG: hypothetical protein FXF47_04985 [Candidatus Mcinerneyibacterium aminivorans]|uniref:Lipoprotein n=1 Tax=Candidatus Mcinerneyibacterium aminivorans TaxID=2703815 RepID=A0A5D0MIM7_9BACT|nr:MAG: hypothetical protein FXF47_04985 [Candidatus Mcinerneyibacterium aminivorans]
MKKIIISIVIIVLLSGCATMGDYYVKKDYDKFNKQNTITANFTISESMVKSLNLKLIKVKDEELKKTYFLFVTRMSKFDLVSDDLFTDVRELIFLIDNKRYSLETDFAKIKDKKIRIGYNSENVFYVERNLLKKLAYAKEISLRVVSKDYPNKDFNLKKETINNFKKFYKKYVIASNKKN